AIAARRLLDRAAFLLEKAAGETRTADVSNGPTGAIRAARFAPNGDLAIAHGKVISIYRGVHLTRTLRAHGDLVGALAFSPDGAQLVSASRDKSVIVWDVASGKPRKLHAHHGAITSVAWSPDGA